MSSSKFPLFNDVQDLTLRTYNRAVTMFNVLNDHDAKKLEEYSKNFSHKELIQIRAMLAYIGARGAEEVRREMSLRVNNITIEDDVNV